MTALNDHERQRYDFLRSQVLARVESVAATARSFHLQLASTVSAQDVAEWMALEHRCCPFVNIALSIRSDDTRWVELGGSEAIKDFLRNEFSSILR